MLETTVDKPQSENYSDPEYAALTLWLEQNVTDNLNVIHKKCSSIMKLKQSPYHAWLTTVDSLEGVEERKTHQCATCKTFMDKLGSLIFLDDTLTPRSVVFHADDLSGVPEKYREHITAVSKYITAEGKGSHNVVNLSQPQLRRIGNAAKGVFDGNYYHLGASQAISTTLAFIANRNTNLDVSPARLEKVATLYVLLDKHLDKLKTTLRFEDFPESEHVINTIYRRVEMYREADIDRTVFLKSDLAQDQTFATLLGTLAGNVVMDIIEGRLTYSDIIKSYRARRDPRYYQRPSRLPSAPQLENDLKELASLGLVEALNCRLMTVDDITPYMKWMPAKPEPKEPAKFASKLTDKVSPTEPATAEPVLLELEGISFKGFREILTNLIANGEIKTIQVDPRAPALVLGGGIVGVTGEFGKLRKDESNISMFYFGDQISRTNKGMDSSLDIDSTRGIVFADELPISTSESDQLFVVHQGTFNQPIPLPMFPEDLKSEYKHLSRTIEAYCAEYPVNVDEDDLVVSNPNEIIIQPIQIGSEVVIVTAVHVLQFRIVCMR